MKAPAPFASSNGTARNGARCRTGFRPCAMSSVRRSKPPRPRKAGDSATRCGTAPRNKDIPKQRALFAAAEWLPGLVARVPATVQAKLLVAFLATAVLLITLGAVGLQVLSGVNRRAEDL